MCNSFFEVNGQRSIASDDHSGVLPVNLSACWEGLTFLLKR
jgi:hypothetical protein